jgi:alkanesulfonate monooxygenase SsuD/methylene tetrahydromethanopterin reductase-like flavin-dependent oxidoreductase (luciferase family)
LGVGVYLPISHPHGLPAAADVLDYAREAELLGFDALWVGDHLLWRTPLLEATTTLAAAAAVTERIALGTNVLLLGLRPSLLAAKTLGTLAYLAQDRLVLGIGVGGEFPEEFQALDIPLAGRGARLDRTLDEVRRWWGHLPGAARTVAPAPSPDVPLWIGGRSDVALARTVRTGAQAWTGHFVDPEQAAGLAARLRELAAAAGAPAPQVAITINISVGAEEDARAFAEAHFGLPFDRIGRHVVRGDLDACAERLLAYRDVADHLVLFPAAFDVRGQLEPLAALRERLDDAFGPVPAITRSGDG